MSEEVLILLVVPFVAATVVALVLRAQIRRINQMREREMERMRREREEVRSALARVPRPAAWPAPPEVVGHVPPHRMPPSPVPRTARSFTASPTPTRRDDDDAGSALLAMSMLNSHSPAMPFAHVPSDPAPFRSGSGGDYGGGGASASWDSGSSCSSSDSSSSSSDSSCSSSSD